MPFYQPIAIAAQRLDVSIETLRELAAHGWVQIDEKDGNLFLSGRHEYKAKFILHLRQKLRLSDAEIAKVLDKERPPYSLQDVPEIIGRRV
jgi:DNA-binding transcriptional MerR regulator